MQITSRSWLWRSAEGKHSRCLFHDLAHGPVLQGQEQSLQEEAPFACVIGCWSPHHLVRRDVLVPLTAKEAKASATSAACYSRTTLRIPEVHRNRLSLSSPRSPCVWSWKQRGLWNHTRWSQFPATSPIHIASSKKPLTLWVFFSCFSEWRQCLAHRLLWGSGERGCVKEEVLRRWCFLPLLSMSKIWNSPRALLILLIFLKVIRDVSAC